MISISELYAIYRNSGIISTDTRNLPKGCLYFALKGENFNGNQFAAEALQKGAAYAVVDEKEFVLNDQCILVDGVLKTLQEIALYHRQQFQIPVLGITGSNGKTTTKELLASVLSQKLKTHVTRGNLNNHIGVPLTILSMPADTEIAVIEMGANKVGDNEELCDIFNPNYGLITNIGKEHLEGFGDLEGVARGNSELYYHLYRNQGTAFVNADDPTLMRMAARLGKKVTYGFAAPADYLSKAIQLNPQIELQLGETYIHSVLFGKYNAENILAAIAIGEHFGLDDIQIKTGIENYIPGNNRSQIIKKGNNTLIVDCYNANPSSMELAIRNFADSSPASPVLMLGDMFEMGEHEFIEHMNLVLLLKKLRPGHIFLCGKAFEPHKELTKCEWFEDVEALSEYIKQNPPENTTILIKGSRGMKMEKVLEAF